MKFSTFLSAARAVTGTQFDSKKAIGVALSHRRLKKLTSPIGALTKTTKQIDFGTNGNEPVALFFALLVPDKEN